MKIGGRIATAKNILSCLLLFCLLPGSTFFRKKPEGHKGKKHQICKCKIFHINYRILEKIRCIAHKTNEIYSERQPPILMINKRPQYHKHARHKRISFVHGGKEINTDHSAPCSKENGLLWRYLAAVDNKAGTDTEDGERQYDPHLAEHLIFTAHKYEYIWASHRKAFIYRGLIQIYRKCVNDPTSCKNGRKSRRHKNSGDPQKA